MYISSLQIKRCGYSSQSDESVLAPGSGQQLRIRSLTLFNGSAASMDLAVGVKKDPNFVTLWVDAVESALPSVSAPLIIIPSGDSGTFTVGCKDKFNHVNLTVSVHSGAAVNWQAAQSIGSGSYGTCTVLNRSASNANGVQHIVLNIPDDFAPDTDGLYKIKFSLSGNALANLTITDISVINQIAYRPNVFSIQQMRVKFDQPFKLESLEEIVPFFSVADTSNMVEISYLVDS